MNILVIEDDENKREQIIEFVASICPGVGIATARSLQGGIRSLLNSKVELIILDMTMPTFDIGPDEDGGRPQAYAGREILRRMERLGILVPVVVVTQFDRFSDDKDAMTLEELDGQLRHEHSKIYQGVVYYDAAVTGWREKLNEIVCKILTGQLTEH